MVRVAEIVLIPPLSPFYQFLAPQREGTWPPRRPTRGCRWPGLGRRRAVRRPGEREREGQESALPSDCQEGLTLNAGALAAKPVFNSDWKLVPTRCSCPSLCSRLTYPSSPPSTTLTSLSGPGSCSSSPERSPSPTKPRSPTAFPRFPVSCHMQ